MNKNEASLEQDFAFLFLLKSFEANIENLQLLNSINGKIGKIVIKQIFETTKYFVKNFCFIKNMLYFCVSIN
jgi:hypothetical protein